MNVYEIGSILNHKNIISISEFSFLTINSYTDYIIQYGNGKEIRRVLDDTADFKNTLNISIPLVEDPQWIKYLEKKINQNLNIERKTLTTTIKLNPQLQSGDYIAVSTKTDENHADKFDIGEQRSTTDSSGYKRSSYELFKIFEVTHDINNFISNITAYLIPTDRLHTSVTVDN